ncbi:MAG: hypothetical protein LUH08_00095 [Ruminococcus sp.]|nr:hypothetical protein [Ruminococcus sp.]
MASSDDFSTLREQALRRMQQMHANSASPPEPVEEKSVKEDAPKPPPSPPRRTPSPLSGFLNSLAGLGGQKGQKSILDELHIDEDAAIIGILIYILYKNGADIKLMLALGYLLI